MAELAHDALQRHDQKPIGEQRGEKGDGERERRHQDDQHAGRARDGGQKILRRHDRDHPPVLEVQRRDGHEIVAAIMLTLERARAGNIGE